MNAPPLKTDPVYGVIPWWPDDSEGWIHPEDTQVVHALLPGDRVFRREGEEGPFVVMHYGDVQFRIKRRLWEVVPTDGLDIGDQVEVLSRGGKNTYRIGTIREMRWHQPSRSIHYQIADGEHLLSNVYTAEDLRLLSS